MADEKTRKTPDPRDVKFDLVAYDELPEAGRRGPSSGALTQIVDQVKELVTSGEVAPNTPICTNRYAKATAAGAAANVLRKRYGKTAAPYGLTFATRKVQEDDGEQRTGLFVMFDPKAIVKGEQEKQDALYKAYLDHLAETRKAREAKAAAEAK